MPPIVADGALKVAAPPAMTDDPSMAVVQPQVTDDLDAAVDVPPVSSLVFESEGEMLKTLGFLIRRSSTSKRW